MNGAKLDIQVDGSSVKVNNATVTATDIAASNGMIYVVDQVILPAN